MKKTILILFIIGALLGLVDTNNMMMFFITKVFSILFIAPLFIRVLKKGEI